MGKARCMTRSPKTAVSISAEQERNDAELASRLRDLSIDSLKRFAGIVLGELARRGVWIEKPRPDTEEANGS